jgi:hypothetical protein
VSLPAIAKDDIEYVQEHLPEVAMDNRYATLPLWDNLKTDAAGSSVSLQSAYSNTTAGNLAISGPLFTLAGRWNLAGNWSLDAFGFYDPLRLESDHEERDLQTLFAPSTPIDRPVAATFTSLDGSATDIGVGLGVAKRVESGWLGAHRWLGGVIWQRMSLRDYRFDYRLDAGPQAGTTGTLAFDADYTFVVPYAGLDLPRQYGQWETSFHLLLAYPMPRHGVVGHITGPDFDIHGDTADVGNGTHVGDPSLTIGYTLTYLPAHLSIDVGSLLSQALLEPYIHPGIDRNIVLSFSVGL